MNINDPCHGSILDCFHFCHVSTFARFSSKKQVIVFYAWIRSAIVWALANWWLIVFSSGVFGYSMSFTKSSHVNHCESKEIFKLRTPCGWLVSSWVFSPCSHSCGTSIRPAASSRRAPGITSPCWPPAARWAESSCGMRALTSPACPWWGTSTMCLGHWVKLRLRTVGNQTMITKNSFKTLNYQKNNSEVIAISIYIYKYNISYNILYWYVIVIM